MSERTEKAVALFKAGASCAQAVVAAYSDLFGVDEPTAMRLACGLGAGVGRLREVCGAVSGLAVLAGLKHAGGQPDAAAKKRTYAAVQEMAGEFRRQHGQIVCRALLGLEKAEGDPTPSERTEAYYQKRPCAAYVESAALLVERFLLAPPS
jgi:C_GCAxxG_C_C family probable redox protein